MPNNKTTQTEAWDVAIDSCMTHIKSATALGDVVKRLRGIDVMNVVPIVSTLRPSILITPSSPDDAECIRILTKRIGTLIELRSPWQAIESGATWLFRAIVAGEDGVVIDIATMIPSTKTNQFVL